MRFHSIPSSSAERAFTMVEIAISIAIVGFALVAIIGVLPTGLNVQRDNREDTIINNDATFFIEAILNGPGSTNLFVLTNNMVLLDVTNSGVHLGAGTPSFTNGQLNAAQIVGYLSMPSQNGQNSCYGQFRSISATLSDRQAGAGGLAFTYQVTPTVDSVSPSLYTNYYSQYLTNNLWEVRLLFQWPVIGANTGDRRLTVRRMVSGALTQDASGLFFFQRNTFLGP